jgi:preprotein translocase subunit SecA
MENLRSRFHLLNFGIGTGKSLICASLGILLKLSGHSQVVILNKSKYLAYRDYTKNKEIIKKLGFTSLYNQFYQNSICFWDE